MKKTVLLLIGMLFAFVAMAQQPNITREVSWDGYIANAEFIKDGPESQPRLYTVKESPATEIEKQVEKTRKEMYEISLIMVYEKAEKLKKDLLHDQVIIWWLPYSYDWMGHKDAMIVIFSEKLSFVTIDFINKETKEVIESGYMYKDYHTTRKFGPLDDWYNDIEMIIYGPDGEKLNTVSVLH